MLISQSTRIDRLGLLVVQSTWVNRLVCWSNSQPKKVIRFR